jgi:glutathione synthase/RimK-type ligase-like ATP-grasp enzyme
VNPNRTLLLYSRREPYLRFLDSLESRITAAGFPSVSRVAIDELVLSPALDPRNLWLPCTNDEFAAKIVAALLALGATVLNPGIAKHAADRLLICCALNSASIPTPPFWAAESPAEFLQRVPADGYPLILKGAAPRAQKQLIRDEEALRFWIEMRGEHSRTVYFAQQVVGGEIPPTYLKVYVVGDEVEVYRKHLDHTYKPSPVPATEEITAIARRVSTALSLDFFSCDVIETTNGVFVVDVNHLPVFKYWPAATRHLASLLCR